MRSSKFMNCLLTNRIIYVITLFAFPIIIIAVVSFPLFSLSLINLNSNSQHLRHIVSTALSVIASCSKHFHLQYQQLQVAQTQYDVLTQLNSCLFQITNSISLYFGLMVGKFYTKVLAILCRASLNISNHPVKPDQQLSYQRNGEYGR